MAKSMSRSRWMAGRPVRPSARSVDSGQWSVIPTVRPVVNTDGEVLRKVELRPTTGMASTTTLQFRRGARQMGFGPVSGGYHVRRPEYYRESGPEALCLCKQAGSIRCPVSGHAKRNVPAPAVWGDEPAPVTYDPVTGRPLWGKASDRGSDSVVVLRHPSGAKLRKR